MNLKSGKNTLHKHWNDIEPLIRNYSTGRQGSSVAGSTEGTLGTRSPYTTKISFNNEDQIRMYEVNIHKGI